jgi:hypothetical protein
VLGLGIFSSILAALVCDDTRKPSWLPVGLFDFPKQSLPTNWEFRLHDGRAASGVVDEVYHWVAIWGYPELVHNISHSDGLMERDPEALDFFYNELAKLTDTGNSP